MIYEIHYIKKIDDTLTLFSYSPQGRELALYYGDRIGIDGLTWIYDNREYEMFFKPKEFEDAYFSMKFCKLFLHYNGTSPTYPAPDSVVVYTPTGEVERILTPPILPTGKKGKGFYQIGRVPDPPKGDVDTYMRVKIWEHEYSPWIYVYLVNVETYEFIFEYKRYM